ncbi:DUF885 domain-containing protein [Pseudomarimonas arenosa]|nr:DUF885 domain-containing protein [Pseudomarimonas arenosa]
MIRTAFFSLCLLSTATQAADAGKALHALFDQEWQRELKASPVSASMYGERQYDALMPDLRETAIKKAQRANHAALKQLQAIDFDALSPADRLNYRVFEWQLKDAIAGEVFPQELLPISQQGGIQTFHTLVEQLPLQKAADYRNWLARLGQLDRLIGQNLDLMKRGVKRGVVPPRVVMQRVLGQINAQVVEKAEDSPFWGAFVEMPASISADDQQALRADARAVLNDKVIPAYRQFRDYFEQVYLPACSESIAVTDLPGGKDYYRWLAQHFTTTELTPDQIHQIGLEEVARIRSDMEKVKGKVGFEGDLAAFFHHLRSDPQFFYSDPNELLKAYRDTAKRIDPELVKVFRKLPRLTYGVRAIPDEIAPDTYTAYYQPGALDGSRAGYYYVNLYKPESRPKWEMMALSLHESVPGHHFQFALGAELPDQPMFRRTAYVVAYGEGWALYAERLGYDMGLYDDPYDQFGQLTYDMWRAVRLVVDTGMHAKGWTRDQAIEYFRSNAPKTEQDIVNEIDRYIAWPGQALGYKIGQLRILEIRAKAEKALGERFDLRAFHDALLGVGSVPLAVLEAEMDDWVRAQMN